MANWNKTIEPDPDAVDFTYLDKVVGLTLMFVLGGSSRSGSCDALHGNSHPGILDDTYSKDTSRSLKFQGDPKTKSMCSTALVVGVVRGRCCSWSDAREAFFIRYRCRTSITALALVVAPSSSSVPDSDDPSSSARS